MDTVSQNQGRPRGVLRVLKMNSESIMDERGDETELRYLIKHTWGCPDGTCCATPMEPCRIGIE